VPIFGPPHAIEVASKLLLAFWDKALLPNLVALSPIPLEENRLLFSSPSVHISASPVEHGPETLAVRFVEQKTGASLVYSSDTLPCESMVRFASGADDLLHDSTFCKESNGAEPLFGHSSARQAAVVARRAGVKRLILVHFASASPDVSDCVAQASREFEGPIVAASDFQEFVRDESEDS
jgi:ribonuclease Z